MVKITFKTVQNKLFTIDAEDNETVTDLKKKIQESQTFPVENQKLIYSGKILQDGATVASLKIKEKDFLVVMVSKPKAAPAAAPAAAAPAPAPSSAPAPAASEAPAAAAPAASAPSTEAAAPTAPAAADAAPAAGGGASQGGSFVTGDVLQQAIASMVEMGFERDQVQRALRASFNNPDRAVEYLMNGNIPDVAGGGFGGGGGGGAQAAPAAAPAAPAAAPSSILPQQPAAAAPAPAAAAPAGAAGSAENLFAAAEAAMNRDRGGGAAPAGAAAGAAGAAGRGGAAPGGMDPAAFAALAANPQMAAIRNAVQENPALIQPLLQHLASANPQLAAMIAQHPEALYELLGGGDMGDDDEEYPGGAGGNQVMQVDLSPDEVAAVERLEGLGFPRQAVLQAYLLCDKNEELAANFLFDAGDEDM